MRIRCYRIVSYSLGRRRHYHQRQYQCEPGKHGVGWKRGGPYCGAHQRQYDDDPYERRAHDEEQRHDREHRERDQEIERNRRVTAGRADEEIRVRQS